MTETQRCCFPGCELLATASGPFCRGHLISTCYERLEAYAKLQKEHRLGEIAAESVRQFIHECVREADSIEHNAKDLDDLERARLLDIILWATDLGRNVRRSPRKVVSIPLRVCFDKPGHPSVEETETQLMSRHGAWVQCQRAVEIDETLVAERKDTGRKDRARVAWSQRKGSTAPLSSLRGWRAAQAPDV